MRVESVGHAVYAATLIALGLLGLVQGGFAPIWAPVPRDLPARELLSGLCTFVCLAAGVGLLWRRAAAPAARLLFAWLLLWLLLFKMPAIARGPGVAAAWESCGETAVMVAAAWVLHAWFAAVPHGRRPGFARAAASVRLAQMLYGLALVAFGVAHFAYAVRTAALVPAWLPAHLAWVQLTGGTYVAAGAALLANRWARLAAALALVQMALFTLLVWGPAVAAGPDAFQWSEFVVSWCLTAGGWVVADSLRGLPWLAAHRR
jgi:uncharacterized membrane protein